MGYATRRVGQLHLGKHGLGRFIILFGLHVILRLKGLVNSIKTTVFHPVLDFLKLPVDETQLGLEELPQNNHRGFQILLKLGLSNETHFNLRVFTTQAGSLQGGNVHLALLQSTPQNRHLAPR